MVGIISEKVNMELKHYYRLLKSQKCWKTTVMPLIVTKS
jgi:hypothetical protein